MSPRDGAAGTGDARSRVFVYGTLRTGGSNHFRMAGATFVSAGAVRGRLYRIDWYPGLVLDPAGDPIAGEIYEVGAEQLAALDEFEGISAAENDGCEYRRVEAPAILPDGLGLTVQVWEWIGPVDETARMVDWLTDR